MTVCANCSHELQPQWKFCVYCGTPTGVPITQAIAIIRGEAWPQPTELAAATDPAEVLRVEDIPEDEEPAAVDPAPAPAPKFNVLAVLALILGCLASPLAALFGHIALSQIGRSNERGTAIAWVAIVLGYLSLAAILVLGISYLVLNA